MLVDQARRGGEESESVAQANPPIQQRVGFQTPTIKQRMAETWKQVKKHKAGYLFLAPFMVLFIVFTVGPVLTAIYLSFTYFNVLQPPNWIGLTNYRLLFLEDDIFLKSLHVTVVFAILTGPVGFLLSFIMAWLINQVKVRLLYVVAFYAPSLSGIGMAQIMRIFFANDRYGYLNNFLIRWGILDEPFPWLADIDTMLGVVIAVQLWMSMGPGFLSFLAGLQQIDESLYEAGKVDGVRNRLQELWFITLPLVRPQLVFGAVMAVVGAFSMFDISVGLVGFPSPQYAAHSIMAHLYDYAFLRFEMGYASAVSVVMFLMMFLLSSMFRRMLSTRGQW